MSAKKRGNGTEGAREIGGSLHDLENASLSTFAADRDEFLDVDIPESALPQTEDDFLSRDPFSADYVEFQHAKAELRREVEGHVKTELREDMLVKPHLMKKPEEGAHRGAAAVWRSLRDQLHEESLAQIDTSGKEELLLLKNDLITRKAVVDTVSEGIGNLLKRLDGRLKAFDEGGDTADEIKPAAPAKDSPAGKL